jgi:quinol monooxygenase YgiN
MLHVLATVDLKPGKRDLFLQAFSRYVPFVREEDGCLEYGPAVEVPCPAAGSVKVNENRVIVMEKWRDREALETHLQTESLARFREQIGHWTQAVDIRVFEPR